jgi:hypothetical protein
MPVFQGILIKAAWLPHQPIDCSSNNLVFSIPETQASRALVQAALQGAEIPNLERASMTSKNTSSMDFSVVSITIS